MPASKAGRQAGGRWRLPWLRVVLSNVRPRCSPLATVAPIEVIRGQDLHAAAARGFAVARCPLSHHGDIRGSMSGPYPLLLSGPIFESISLIRASAPLPRSKCPRAQVLNDRV